LPASDETGAGGDRQRLDKWLWFARIVKTREAAAALVESGHVRLNGNKVLKPGHGVKTGDVLTLVLHTRVRVLHVSGFAARRGPADAARRLYSEPAMSGREGDAPQKEDASPDGNC
jgi:ribosome-associated heat shock protein Hsp15